MLGILLFIASFIIVILSSYFFVALIKDKRLDINLIYFFLTIISQIIISIEALSLVKLISTAGILTVNIVIFFVSMVIWNYNGKPKLDISEVNFLINKIKTALMLDKSLIVVGIFFLFASLVSLFLAFVTPVHSADSMIYHTARIPFWIQHGSLNHFETSSIRQLMTPINSEILILWSMIFLKGDYLAQMLEYFAYLGCIIVLGGYLSYLKVNTRRILWTVFILASLPAILIEASSAQTNLFMGFLLFSSFYLFVKGIKEENKTSLMFSALAYAIAIGTKTTALLFIPVIGIFYIIISVKEKGKLFYKPLIFYILSGISLFLFFASYNYFLNFFEWNNFIGAPPYISSQSISITPTLLLGNLVRHLSLFLDFSGIPQAAHLTPLWLHVKTLLFNLLNLPVEKGLIGLDQVSINTKVHENLSTFGIIGFLIFIPLVLKYGITGIFSKNHKRFYICLISMSILGFIICISAIMGFNIFLNRYLTTAVILSSSIFIFSYKKKFYLIKGTIITIVLFNFLVISVFNQSKPFLAVVSTILKNDSQIARYDMRYRDENNFSQKYEEWTVYDYLRKNIPNNSKIAILMSDADWFYPFYDLNPSWKIFPLRYELLVRNKNYNNYDYLVIKGEWQFSDLFDAERITYNYEVKDKYFFYDIEKAQGKFFVYQNILLELIDKGIPYRLVYKIEFSDIPSNFKLVKAFTQIQDGHFYIYKRIG